GHDNAAGKLRRRERKHRTQHRAIAQMNVKVIRPADRDAVDALGRRLFEQFGHAHWTASSIPARITAIPATKSSRFIASFGLCEPFSLRTNIMALGIPAFA